MVSKQLTPAFYAFINQFDLNALPASSPVFALARAIAGIKPEDYEDRNFCRFTQKEKKLFLKMYHSGCTDQELCNEFNLDMRSVRYRRKYYNLGCEYKTRYRVDYNGHTYVGNSFSGICKFLHLSRPEIEELLLHGKVHDFLSNKRYVGEIDPDTIETPKINQD